MGSVYAVHSGICPNGIINYRTLTPMATGCLQSKTNCCPPGPSSFVSAYSQKEEIMAIFMMFGRYTTEAMRGISPERTEKAAQIIKANGGKIVSMYAVMGEHDLVFTLDFPESDKAFKTSVELNKLTGIAFVTSPVVDVETFDRLIAKAEEI
jgi:uncharacterized protein with GYD domain